MLGDCAHFDCRNERSLTSDNPSSARPAQPRAGGIRLPMAALFAPIGAMDSHGWSGVRLQADGAKPVEVSCFSFLPRRGNGITPDLVSIPAVYTRCARISISFSQCLLSGLRSAVQ